MTAHFKEVCRTHGVIVAQCRCPGPKVERLVDCPMGKACTSASVAQNMRLGELTEEEYAYVFSKSKSHCCFSGCALCRSCGKCTRVPGGSLSGGCDCGSMGCVVTELGTSWPK